ncbi:RNA polymerase sigma factor [Sorangium sp. So ce118]
MTAAAPSVVELDAHPTPTAADVAGQRRFVTRVLATCGIPSRDRPDVAQDVLLAAWQAIEERRYRPADEPPVDALRRYLRGIAWRQASHYRERAQVRLEHLSPDPLREAGQERDVNPTPLDVLLSREADTRLVAIVTSLSQVNQDAIAAAAEHDTLTDCAAVLGAPITTVQNRLRIAAGHIRAALRLADARERSPVRCG